MVVDLLTQFVKHFKSEYILGLSLDNKHFHIPDEEPDLVKVEKKVFYD